MGDIIDIADPEFVSLMRSQFDLIIRSGDEIDEEEPEP
jgi:hypothetical protein